MAFPQGESGNQSSINHRTVRKLDLILLPFLSVLFLVNSLDRSNIGNAETANFTRDAGLQPDDLNVAVACFFAFFVALQPVGAAAGRKFGMSKWVPGVMTIWGLCTLLHIWVRRKWQLILLRIIIGTLEAGFYPTTVSYLSLFYTRFEFGRRLGLFYGSYGVANALGGVLAYLVFARFPSNGNPDSGAHASPDGWKPWQVLFLVEGLLTIIIAVLGFFWLPKSAGSAWFLTAEEREWAEERIRVDRDSGDDEEEEAPPLPAGRGSDDAFPPSYEEEQRHGLLSEENTCKHTGHLGPSAFSSDAGLSRTEILSTVLFLPLIFPILLLNIASAIPSTGFSVFLPLVLSSLKLSSPLHSNILTAPPFLLASITLYVFTYWSDKSRRRILPILVSLGIITLGLFLTLILSSAALSRSKAIALYLSLCILLSGSFIPSPLTVAWFSGNIPGPGKRAIVLGINGYGNLAGVIAALIFSPQWRGEAYRVPFLATVGFILGSFAGYAALLLFLRRVNMARARYVPSRPEDAAEGVPVPEQRAGWNVTEKIPDFSVIGGKWWDSRMRYWVGEKLLRMDAEDVYVRRGDEKLTFSYGL